MTGRTRRNEEDWPKEGVEEEARWNRDTAPSILGKFAEPGRVCLRSKRWWTDEISKLRRWNGTWRDGVSRAGNET